MKYQFALVVGMLINAAPASGQEGNSRTTEDNRRDSRLSLFYAPLDLGIILPVKSGFSATWLMSEVLSWELEYISGSYGIGFAGVDLADFSERLLVARARLYFGNSFNLALGLGKRSYTFALGNDRMASITDYNIAALPTLEVDNTITALTLGNRWQFDNGFTWGVDWVELIITVGRGRIDDQVTSHMGNEKDRKDTRQVLNYLRYGPTMSLMKVHLGYTF